MLRLRIWNATIPNNHENFFAPQEISALVQKATAVNSEHSLDMEVFIDTYGLEKVKSDYSKVADRLQSHTERKMTGPEKIGHVFEAAFLDLASRHKWFGANSEIIHASKFDDIMNGVDMITTVLDQHENARHFEIATDLTISKVGLVAKFTKIKDAIYAGKMAQIDYFHSDIMDFTGRLRNIPRTVVAMDSANTRDFLMRWMQEPELAQEQFALMSLHQIAEQSLGFQKFAQSIHGRENIISRRYRNTHNVAREIIESKSNISLPVDKSTKLITKLSKNIE